MRSVERKEVRKGFSPRVNPMAKVIRLRQVRISVQVSCLNDAGVLVQLVHAPGGTMPVAPGGDTRVGGP